MVKLANSSNPHRLGACKTGRLAQRRNGGRQKSCHSPCSITCSTSGRKRKQQDCNEKESFIKGNTLFLSSAVALTAPHSVFTTLSLSCCFGSSIRFLRNCLSFTNSLRQLRTQLTQALEHSALPDEELLAYIGRFQNEIAKVFLHTE